MSRLMEKLSDSDLDKFIHSLGHLIDSLDRIKIHNDVSISTHGEGNNTWVALPAGVQRL